MHHAKKDPFVTAKIRLAAIKVDTGSPLGPPGIQTPALSCPTSHCRFEVKAVLSLYHNPVRVMDGIC